MNNIIKYNYDFLIKNTEVETIWLNDNFVNDDRVCLTGVIKLKKQPFFDRIEDTHKDKSIITADLESWLYNVMPSKYFKDKMLLRMLIFDIKKTRSVDDITKHCKLELSPTQKILMTGDTPFTNIRPFYSIFGTNNKKYNNVKNYLRVPNKNILDFRQYHLNYQRNRAETIDSIKDFNDHFKEDFFLDKVIKREDILILKKFIIDRWSDTLSEDKTKIVLQNQYHAEIVKCVCELLEVDVKNIIDNDNKHINIDEDIVEASVKNWVDKYFIWDKVDTDYKTLFDVIKSTEDIDISINYIIFCYLMEYE